MKLKTKAKILLASAVLSTSMSFGNVINAEGGYGSIPTTQVTVRGWSFDVTEDTDIIDRFISIKEKRTKSNVAMLARSVLVKHATRKSDSKSGKLRIPKEDSELTVEDKSALDHLCKRFAENINADIFGGRTLLHYAVCFNCTYLVNLLVNKYHADVDLQTKFYELTPLHVATSSRSKPEIIQLLLDHGANKEIESRRGQTADDTSHDTRHEAEKQSTTDTSEFISMKTEAFKEFKKKLTEWVEARIKGEEIDKIENDMDTFLADFKTKYAKIGGINTQYISNSAPLANVAVSSLETMPSTKDLPAGINRMLLSEAKEKVLDLIIKHLIKNGATPNLENIDKKNFLDLVHTRRRKIELQKIVTDNTPNLVNQLKEIVSISSDKATADDLRSKMNVIIKEYAKRHEDMDGSGIEYKKANRDIIHVSAWVFGNTLNRPDLLELFAECLVENGKKDTIGDNWKNNKYLRIVKKVFIKRDYKCDLKSRKCTDGINSKLKYDPTYLHRVVRKYIESSKGTHEKQTGQTMLLHCECLMELGIDPTIRNKDGKTASEVLGTVSEDLAKKVNELFQSVKSTDTTNESAPISAPLAVAPDKTAKTPKGTTVEKENDILKPVESTGSNGKPAPINAPLAITPDKTIDYKFIDEIKMLARDKKYFNKCKMNGGVIAYMTKKDLRDLKNTINQILKKYSIMDTTNKIVMNDSVIEAINRTIKELDNKHTLFLLPQFLICLKEGNLVDAMKHIYSIERTDYCLDTMIDIFEL